MRKLFFVLLVLLLVIPVTNSFSASFVDPPGPQFFTEHRYFDDTSATSFSMIASSPVDTNAYNVFLHTPSHQYLLTEQEWFGNYDEYKFFSSNAGFPVPGPLYENIDFDFFIDTNGNGNFDPSSDPYQTLNIPSGTFRTTSELLPFVDNVKVTYVGSDVHLSWNGIPLVGNFGNDVNDKYEVKVINRDTGDFVDRYADIAINSLNQYSLDLGDLSVYGDNFWLRIEAKEGIGDVELANRSSYYASCRAVPEPTAMLLFGAGLVGLAGFGRKKFKK
jgi:hypothetical protein